jgi:hypothetical protein
MFSSEKRGLFVNRKEVKEWEIFSLEIVKESMVLILEPEFSYTVAFKAQLLKACKDYKNAVSLKKAKPIGSNLLIGKKDLIWEFIPQRDVRSLKIRNLAVNKYLEVKRSGEIHLTSRPKNDLWSTFQIFGDHDGTVMIVALGTNLLVGLCIDWEGVESLRADSPKKTVDESFFLLRET